MTTISVLAVDANGSDIKHLPEGALVRDLNVAVGRPADTEVMDKNAEAVSADTPLEAGESYAYQFNVAGA